MAIARENSARGQPNCSAIGIWNTPKLARMPKPTSTMRQLARRTGVMRGERWAIPFLCARGGDPVNRRIRGIENSRSIETVQEPV